MMASTEKKPGRRIIGRLATGAAVLLFVAMGALDLRIGDRNPDLDPGVQTAPFARGFANVGKEELPFLSVREYLLVSNDLLQRRASVYVTGQLFVTARAAHLYDSREDLHLDQRRGLPVKRLTLTLDNASRPLKQQIMQAHSCSFLGVGCLARVKGRASQCGSPGAAIGDKSSFACLDVDDGDIVAAF